MKNMQQLEKESQIKVDSQSSLLSNFRLELQVYNNSRLLWLA